MAISQEGMEACQKRNNMLMRLGCNFANVGRIPWKVWQAGREAVRAYLDERAAKKKSPQEWLWRRNVLSFFSSFNDAFARVEKCKRERRACDWKTQFSPEWVSCVAISTIYRIGTACARRRAARARMTRIWSYTWRRVEQPIKDELAGRCYRVRVTDARTFLIAKDIAEYYAPVPCESRESFALMCEAAQRKEIQRERRALAEALAQRGVGRAG